MTTQYLEYPLREGHIDTWLAAGPIRMPSQAEGANDAGEPVPPELPEAATAREWDPPFTVAGQTLRWRYLRSTGDHWLDLAERGLPENATAWLYCELVSGTATEISLRLSYFGTVRCWMNGVLVLDAPQPGTILCSESLNARLRSGSNTILARIERRQPAPGPMMLALRVIGQEQTPNELTVRLPSVVQNTQRRLQLENIIQAAYTDSELARREEWLAVHWPPEMADACELIVQLRDADDSIFCETKHTARGGSTAKLVAATQNPSGRYQIVVMPELKEYYEEHQRVSKRIPIHTHNEPYDAALNNSLEQRRQEALEHIQRTGGALGELARMELGAWNRLRPGILADAIAGAGAQTAAGINTLVGATAAALHHASEPRFPAEVLDALQGRLSAVLREPAPEAEECRFATQVLTILAEKLFPGLGLGEPLTSGTSRLRQAEEQAMSWMQRSALGGYAHWGADDGLADELALLVPTAQWAASPQLRQMALALTSRALYELALNATRGLFTAAQARADAVSIRHPLLAACAGISRYLWGMGTYNRQCGGLYALAAAPSLALPPLLGRIARNMPAGLWSLEHHASLPADAASQEVQAWEVYKTSYRTPDYMLASAQDWRPGERGAAEHIWQATLGPDAVVFTNHPGYLSENPLLEPNYWRGNGILPRVMQWKDTLAALYQLPANEPLSFTHAYFPVRAFDEYYLEGCWAFARVGDAYLALMASTGLELMTDGLGAWRELRSLGQQTVWLCHLGSAEQDVDFSEFQQHVLSLPVTVEGSHLRCRALRGDTLELGWKGSMLVNGAELARDPAQYRSRYCQAEWPARKLLFRLGAASDVIEYSAASAENR